MAYPKVHIRNYAARRFAAQSQLKAMRKEVIAKMFRFAGAIGLDKNKIYDLAEENDLYRMLYKNKVVDLERLYDDLVEKYGKTASNQ